MKKTAKYENTVFDDLSFKITSVYVLNLKLVTPIEFLLLKNCVGQINSTRELNKTNLMKEYNIKTTKISSKILYIYTSNLPENNNSNIWKKNK